MVEKLDVDCLASRPVVLFLNGEYWGIYYLQEKPDERFLQDHYDIDMNTINIINSWNGHDCEYGSSEAYQELFEWIRGVSLDDEENYQYVAARIDINNFIDYEIFEIFSANLDWPSNNMRCWQAGDGLWRWLFFDGDACLFRPWIDFDAFANATYDGNEHYPSSSTSTLLFRKLLENETFKTQFLSRFFKLLSTTFHYESTKPIYDATYMLISDEIASQSSRFGYPESFSKWKEGMERIDKFLSQRVDEINNALCERFLSDNQGITTAESYPNPVQDYLCIKIETVETTKANVQIIDLRGHSLFFETHVFGKGETIFRIPIHFKQGVYLLKIGNISKKIVVIG